MDLHSYYYLIFIGNFTIEYVVSQIAYGYRSHRGLIFRAVLSENVVSHPILWFLLSNLDGRHWLTNFVVLELCVILVETFIGLWFFRNVDMSYRRIIFVTILANSITAALTFAV